MNAVTATWNETQRSRGASAPRAKAQAQGGSRSAAS